MQIRHQPGTTPTFNSYRWEVVPVEIVGANKWDGHGWSKIVAPRYTNVEINADFGLSINGSFESNNLTVSSGATLTIESGETLIVHGFLANEGAMVVESNGSLITKGGVSGAGYTITRNTTFTSGRYSALGSPVSGASTDVLGSIVYGYDESAAYGVDGSSRFAPISSPETMNPGDAYFSAFTGTVTFTGTPNTGQIDSSVGLQRCARWGQCWLQPGF